MLKKRAEVARSPVTIARDAGAIPKYHYKTGAAFDGVILYAPWAAETRTGAVRIKAPLAPGSGE